MADIPLVFETGREKDFDAIIVVACPREMQLQRLMERNKLSKEDAEKRLAALTHLVERDPEKHRDQQDL